jgi:hypothetical protein
VKNTTLDSLDRGKWLQAINQGADRAKITPPSIRMSFQLHNPNTLKLHLLPTTFLRCPLGEVTIGRGKIPTGQNRTGELPPLLTGVNNGFDKSGRVLDFTVTISTDLKLFFVGDSVMLQFAQVIDESLGGRNTETRKILWKTGGVHESGTVLAPTRGGGLSAFWRMTGLLSKSKMGRAPANSPGGGWSQEQIDLFLNHSYHPVLSEEEESHPHKNMTRVGRFDVVLLRVMHGWMQLNEITHERIVEAIALSFELLGATTVVLMTVPFTNNVKSTEDMDKVSKINEDIREIARTWHLRMDCSDKCVQHILVIEYGMYCNQIIWSNARHLNYSVSLPLGAPDYVFDLEGPNFLLDRLDNDGQLYGDFPPSIPSKKLPPLLHTGTTLLLLTNAFALFITQWYVATNPKREENAIETIYLWTESTYVLRR